MKKVTLYSKDFNFFLQEQIGIVTTGNGRESRFFSRLDGALFKETRRNEKMTDEQEKEICKDIHLGLKYYKD